jgi:hypothetical protein
MVEMIYPSRFRVLLKSGAKRRFRAWKKDMRELYHSCEMAFPIRICAVCSEEFELKPDKPGFANRCPECSEPEPAASQTKKSMDADERKTMKEANEARRHAMRDLLYRKDS